jgi:hypothetical protein
MKYQIITVIVFLLTSCAHSVGDLSKKITDSDSLAINWFKGDGSIDTVVAVKIIKDKIKINQLAKFAGGKVTKQKNCGYDGSLHFFKMNRVIQDVDFRINDEQCSYFQFILNGKAYKTMLPPEAKQILVQLK